MTAPPTPGVIRARIRPPRPPRGAVERQRLSERIQDGTASRLVVVVAGPGYGKSTAMLQAVAVPGTLWAWCSCDPRMKTPAALAANLIGALQEPVPGFAAAQPVVGDAGELALMLANEADLTFASDVLLVLDDVHLTLGLPAWDLIEHLVADMPPSAHLALVSRVPLPLNLSRMRAAGTVLELDESDLALTPEEAIRLASESGLEIDEQQARELYELTEGWPAGFILAARHGRVPSRWREAGRDALFAYLAEEVVSALPQADQDILERTAITDRLSPALVSALAGESDAPNVIRRLANDRFFIGRIDADGEWYRMHHLLLAFLRRRLEHRPPGERDELHRRAARVWGELGDAAMAVRHLIGAGEHRAALDALEPVAESMAMSPDAAELAAWLEAIPEELWRSRPALILGRATLDYVEGRFEASFSAMEHAVDELIRRGEHERAAVALVRLWQNMNAAGTAVRRRIEVTEPLLARIETATPHRILGRLMLATGYAWAGDRGRAGAEIDAARAAGSHPATAAFALAAQAFYIDFPAGAAESAERTLHGLRKKLESTGAAEAGTLAVFVGAFRAIILNELGRFDDALAEIARASLTARRYGFVASAGRVAAWIRLVALAGLGRLEELEAELVEPPSPEDETTATHYAYRFLTPAAALAASRGDSLEVQRISLAARVAIEKQGPEVDQPFALCDIAEAAFAVGLDDLAGQLLAEARETAIGLALPRARARACILMAAAGDPHAADRVAEALDLTDAVGLLSVWTDRCRSHAPGALTTRLAHGAGDDERIVRVLMACGHQTIEKTVELVRSQDVAVRRRFADALQRGGVESADVRALRSDPDPRVRGAARRALAGAPSVRGELTYRGLGGFAVWRDGVPLSRAGFGREKARALLASLLCAGRPVHRDELLEWHWPGLPEPRAVRAFHVTMHALRRALGRDVRSGDASPIVTTGEGYEMRLAAGDSFDVDAFLRLAHEATATRDLPALLDAEAAYAGPLYPEWPYSEWSAERRRECERALVTVLDALADVLLEQGRAREAIVHLERLSNLEPEREEWHRLLMQAYARADERPLALRQFHACRTLLRRELGIEPSQSTRVLYRQILARGEEDAPAAALEGTVTVCFTDIVASTELAARLGDPGFAELMDRHEETVATLAAVNGGTIVKSQGDGFMLSFASARRAAAFATELQRSLAVGDSNAEGLALRIGLHTGEAERRGADLIGTDVVYAARLCARAEAGQVLVSAVVRTLLEPQGAFAFAAPRQVTLKGLPGRHAVSPLILEEPEPGPHGDRSARRGAGSPGRGIPTAP